MTDFYDLFEKQARPREAGTVTPMDPARATRYAHKALLSECENVAAATEGTRNDTLNRAAFNLSQLVAAGHLPHRDTWEALASAARTCGLDDDEIRTTITSGFRAGTDQPRVVPDLPPPPGVTLLTGERGEPAGADDIGDLIRSKLPLLDFVELMNSEDDGEEWILEPLLPARRLVALYSAPKVGKSLLMLEIAVGVSLGVAVLGVTPEPRKVLYVDFENDPRGDIKRRLEAMGYGPEDGARLNENLCYLSFPTIAKLDTPQGAFELISAVAEYGCEVVVIDTVSRAVGGEENDNDTWLAFYRNTGLAMKQAGVACIRLDHSGKDVEKGMRGGSAKYGDVDAVWKLTAASESVLDLVCTDHRMPLDEDRLSIVRESHPVLRHRVSGDRRLALDAREQEIDRAIDALNVPRDTSAREVYRRLKDSGNGFNRQAVMRVVKARKLRLNPVDTSVDNPEKRFRNHPSVEAVPGTGSGTTPGTTAADPIAPTLTWEDASSEAVPEPPRNRPEPVSGGAVPPLYRGNRPRPTPETGTTDPDVLVSCKSCFKPTSAGVAEANGGLCATCHRATGQETP